MGEASGDSNGAMPEVFEDIGVRGGISSKFLPPFMRKWQNDAKWPAPPLACRARQWYDAAVTRGRVGGGVIPLTAAHDRRTAQE